MHPLPVVAVIHLRSSLFFAQITFLQLLIGQCLFAVDADQSFKAAQLNAPASVIRYAEIAPKNEEAVVDLLTRVSQYVENGDLFDDPIVIMLHGAEARVFTRSNYDQYSSVVNLARQLDVQGVIEVQICEIWLSVNGISAEEIPDFIDPVPYGAAVIEEMIESGSVSF